MILDNLYCEFCGGVLLEQTVWYDDDTGYITYYVCLNCGHIQVEDRYRDRVMMIEEVLEDD